MRVELRLAGYGGQGLITAAVILAEAAGLYMGREVVQTQSYGPEARGGSSKADVIISDSRINYPKARHLDVLLALTQEACDKYFQNLKEGGTLLIDETYVTVSPTPQAYVIPARKTVREVFGKDTFINTVALGALAELVEELDHQAVKKALSSRVPPKTLDDNLKAFELGVNLGRKAKDAPPLKPADADL